LSGSDDDLDRGGGPDAEGARASDDDRLVAGLLKGDVEAIATTRAWMRGAFRPYRAQLAMELEDLEQELLLELTSALRAGRFRGESRFQTYVRACVHHKCIDQTRSKRRREWVAIDHLDLRSRAPSALEALVSSENVALALRVAAKMPSQCRQLWRMIEEGLSYKEMSRRTGISEGGLRVRVLRCRKRALRLRARLLSGSSNGIRS